MLLEGDLACGGIADCPGVTLVCLRYCQLGLRYFGMVVCGGLRHDHAIAIAMRHHAKETRTSALEHHLA